ncbi:hypothetical protein [Halomicrobium katesii]|uniref:hypothetical protein n=1 Tax=Halomicrobium katesii TaxID=437163 RepID=UPI001B7FA533|nr:hypothetical protein [Halomicrobium katesii]
MAKQRALLTEKERRQIAGEEGATRKYQATSRVRRRLKDELPEDLQVLEQHNQDLLTELYEAVGPIFYCPICGSPFVQVSTAIQHAMNTDDDEHGLTEEELKQRTPIWWAEEAPSELNFWTEE